MVYRKPSNPPPPLKPPTFQQPVGHLITQDVNSWKWILYMIILWHVKSVVHLFSAPFLLLQNCLAQKFHKTLDARVVNQKYFATRSPRASSSGAPGDTRGYPGMGRKSLLAGYAKRRILCLKSHQWNTHLMLDRLPEKLGKHVLHQGSRRVRGREVWGLTVI